MRPSVFARTFSSLCSLLALSAVGTAAAPTVGSLPPRLSWSEHDERARRIEERLLPARPSNESERSGWSVVERMRAHQVPGLSVAVIHNGRLAWTRSYGASNAARRPVTPSTLFQAGSISKVVASVVALRLTELNEVALDVDVNRYMTRWQIPASPLTAARAVTLRDLLTHSAGATVRGFNGYARGRSLPSLVQVLNGEAPANNAPVRIVATPGTANRYSGGGFEIAQLAMEDATSQPFGRLADDLVFRPLRMSRSTFGSMDHTTNAGDIATGFDTTGTEVAGGWRDLPEQAAASLWSTPTELASSLWRCSAACAATPAVCCDRTPRKR